MTRAAGQGEQGGEGSLWLGLVGPRRFPDVRVACHMQPQFQALCLEMPPLFQSGAVLCWVVMALSLQRAPLSPPEGQLRSHRDLERGLWDHATSKWLRGLRAVVRGEGSSGMLPSAPGSRSGPLALFLRCGCSSSWAGVAARDAAVIIAGCHAAFLKQNRHKKLQWEPLSSSSWLCGAAA